jgi:hypothetical protein
MTATLRKSRTMDMLSQPNSKLQATQEDQILTRVLKRLSHESYDYLRQRDNFKDLSFTFPAS